MTTKPHPLCDMSKPWGVIRFVHKDGEKREFFTMVNEMSGSRLSGFDNGDISIDDPMVWVKSVFHDIRSKSTQVLDYQGTKHFQ